MTPTIFWIGTFSSIFNDILATDAYSGATASGEMSDQLDSDADKNPHMDQSDEVLVS